MILGGGIYFSKQVKPLLIKELNEQLDVKVEVEEVELTSLFNFPRLGIQFKNVTIHEAIEYYEQPMLEAQELNLYVDFLKLLRREYVIDAVSVYKGQIRLADTENGSNYDIFVNDTSDSDPVSFAINDLDLIGCQLSYKHLGSEFSLASDISNASVEIISTAESTNINLKGSLVADSITQSGDRYLKGQTLDLKTEIFLRENFKKVVVSPSELVVDGVKLAVDGVITLDDISYIDLNFNNKESELNKIIPILPDYVQDLFAHLDMEGLAEIKGYFKGEIGENTYPSFGIEYRLDDGTLQSKTDELTLNNIKAQGELSIPSLGNMTSAWVKGKIDRASSGSDYISGKFWVENFEHPLIKWDGKVSFKASTLSTLMASERLKLQSGDVSMIGMFELRYNPDKQEVSQNSFKYIGEVRGRNIQGKYEDPDLDIHQLNIHMLATDRQIVIKQCEMAFNESDISLRGYIRNTNDLFSTRSKSEITGSLEANNLNINNFISSSGDSSKSEIDKILFPYKLILDTKINGLTFNDFTANNIKGTLYSNRRELKIPNANIDALEGSANASIKFTTLGNYYLLDINSKINGMNITHLFRDFNNFEQNEITADHISGKLSGTLLAKVMFDSDFEPALDKLYAKADVEILEGALIGYEPLKELSTFVEVSELENVKFSKLSNTIEIFDQTIFIPKMYIGNSALSIELEGTHTFENYMDYHLNINLIEILAQKSNWFAKKKLQRIEDNAHGGLTAYVHMEGTPDNLKITYDKLSMKKVVNEELQEEKREFIRVLKGQEQEDDTPDSYYEDIWDE